MSLAWKFLSTSFSTSTPVLHVCSLATNWRGHLKMVLTVLRIKTSVLITVCKRPHAALSPASSEAPGHSPPRGVLLHLRCSLSSVYDEGKGHSGCAWAKDQTSLKKRYQGRPEGTSLEAQWLRICLPMQGTRVRALVREDPTCRGAARPVCHNYRACALEPVSLNY